MYKTGIGALIFTLLFIHAIAQDNNYIRVIVPEQDSLTISTLNYRFNASTLPGSRVEIDGAVQKVYPNGAFATYLSLKPGENRVKIVSVHPPYPEVVKLLNINVKLPEPEKTTEGFAIDYVRVYPAMDQNLVTGDIIQVKIKGTPGCSASFLSGKPMYELPLSQTGGIAGIYQGTYMIKENDIFTDVPVEGVLTKPDGEAIKGQSRTKLTVNSGEFPVVGVTKGTFPFLNYGLGEDRLGGAKICYLDTLVKLWITGKTGTLYHVKLSGSQSAYIPDEYVKLLGKGTFKLQSLTSNWTLSGDNRYDYLSIGLTDKLPYTVKYESNPNRIVLDIFGAMPNTNWVTQLNTAREVKNTWYEQPEKDVMRVFIELKNQKAWGYSVGYRQNQLVIKIRQQPRKLALDNLTIGLDAGHGGDNNGALGSTGVKEKDINLAIVNKLKTALEKKGAKVVLTRPDDTYVGMTKRWIIWKDAEVDLAISIHNNSIGYTDPTKIQGTSTYYKYLPFKPLSKAIYNEVLKTGLKEFGNVGHFNFLLNSPTEFPNALVEVAYLSHPEDEMRITDPKFQDKVVKAIVKGIKHYLNE